MDTAMSLFVEIFIFCSNCIESSISKRLCVIRYAAFLPVAQSCRYLRARRVSQSRR